MALTPAQVLALPYAPDLAGLWRTPTDPIVAHDHLGRAWLVVRHNGTGLCRIREPDRDHPRAPFAGVAWP